MVCTREGGWRAGHRARAEVKQKGKGGGGGRGGGGGGAMGLSPAGRRAQAQDLVPRHTSRLRRGTACPQRPILCPGAGVHC